MIDAILNAVYKFLNFIISWFPAGTGFPVEVHNAFETLGSYVGFIDVFIPLTALLFCVKFLFAVEVGIFGFKTIKWILGFVPFFRNNNTN